MNQKAGGATMMRMRERGSAFVIVLIVLMVGVLLGTALLGISLAEFKNAIVVDDMHRAYYIAKAGADAMAFWLSKPTTATEDRDMNTVIQPLLSQYQSNSSMSDFGGGTFLIRFPAAGSKYAPVIESEGHYRNAQRKVTVTLQKNRFYSTAVAIMDSMSIGNGNVQVTGDVAVPDATSLSLPKNVSVTDVIDGTVSYAVQDYPVPVDTITATHAWPSSNTISYTDPSLLDKDYGTVNLGSSDVYFHLNGEMRLEFTDLSANNANVHVDGTGNLIVFVDNLTFKGNLYTSQNCTTTFMILGSGDVAYKTGSSTFQANLYGPGATITFAANAELVGGYVVAGNLVMNSGSELTYTSATNTNVYPEEYGFPSKGYHRVLTSD